MAVNSSLNAVDPRPVVRRLIGQVSGLSTSGANYSPNNQMGGEITFAMATRASGGYGTVTTATIIDTANVIGAVDLHLFSSSITPANDKSATNFSDSAMTQNYMGTISFPAPTSFTNNRGISLSAIGLTYNCTSTILYGYLTTLTQHGIFNSATDITISLTTYQY